MPAAVKKPAAAAAPKSSNPLLEEKRPKNFGARRAALARRLDPSCSPGFATAGIGGALPPKTPLNRYVKWPKYVRIQRQRRVLTKRLKVRPAAAPSPRDRGSLTCPRRAGAARDQPVHQGAGQEPRCARALPARAAPGLALTRRAPAATNLFKLLLKYRPEDKKEKKVRPAALRGGVAAHHAPAAAHRSAC